MPDNRPDDRDHFTESEVASAFAFILSEAEARTYVRELYAVPDRGMMFIGQTYSLLSLVSEPVAARVRARLNETPEQEEQRMSAFLSQTKLLKPRR